jgi:hypothetical protein
VSSVDVSCFWVLFQRLLVVLVDWVLKLVYCILSICIFYLFYRILYRGFLLNLECLVSWPFSRVSLRLENFRR